MPDVQFASAHVRATLCEGAPAAELRELLAWIQQRLAKMEGRNA